MSNDKQDYVKRATKGWEQEKEMQGTQKTGHSPHLRWTATKRTIGQSNNVWIYAD